MKRTVSCSRWRGSTGRSGNRRFAISGGDWGNGRREEGDTASLRPGSGQVNAVLVGRFPHLTNLLEKISEAYLDAMFILADGDSPLSARLKKAKGEPGPGRTSG